jgi:RimJ/RimL family protein N-acetyltransferase
MIERPLFEGELVRLGAINPETDVEAIARWSQDSEFIRLMDSSIARPLQPKALREEMEKETIKPENFQFSIRTLRDDPLIGYIGLWVNWLHGVAWVGIGIGEKDCWGKGYGTDAMQVILRFAFEELNLYRVSLDVFEYNPRAVRSSENAGFSHEGRLRRCLNRNGRRWDLIYMGILRDEWFARQSGN